MGWGVPPPRGEPIPSGLPRPIGVALSGVVVTDRGGPVGRHRSHEARVILVGTDRKDARGGVLSYARPGGTLQK
jgi:hypothetical protein